MNSSPVGVSFEFDEKALQAALKTVNDLVTFNGAKLMDRIAALGESQTRRRITVEKTAPDSTPWAPNREGTSILRRTGQNLLASIAFSSDADTAEWGASWEYAHVHQEGATILPKAAQVLVFKSGGKTVHAKKVVIPARPFVGISEENRAEILDLVTDHFSHITRG